LKDRKDVKIIIVNNGSTTWNYGLKAKLSLSFNFLKYSVKLKNELKETNE
tara:strand:- start:1290 stop:1439 length:150 start_codon:yes stop_codon:yes gene_type:complete